jgi:hypothetical protein
MCGLAQAASLGRYLTSTSVEASSLVRRHIRPQRETLAAPVQETLPCLQFQRTPVMVTLTADRVSLALNPEAANRPVKVSVRGDVRELCPGDSSKFILRREPVAARPVGHD